MNRGPALPYVALTWALLIAGCTHPERSPLYNVDWDRELAEARRHEPELPAAPTPISDTPPPNPPSLPEQGPVDLTIEQALVLALRRNRELSVQQLNPVIAGTFEKLERGVFDPELFVDFRYFEQRALEVSRATTDQFSAESENTTITGGVRQTLPGGTDVELGVSQNRQTSNRSPEQQEARVGLSVTQALLRGSGAAANLVAIRQAELDTQASLYEFRGFTEALLADTEAAYWNVVLAQERIAVFENALELSRQQLDEVEQRIEVGALAQADAAISRAEVALREQALIDARSRLATERLRLLRLLNAGPLGDLDQRLTLSSQPAAQPEPLTDLDDRLRLAQQKRPDLAEARLRLQQDRLETIVTRNGLLPRLDLFISLGKTGFASSFPDNFRNLDGDTYDLTAGVSLSRPLGNEVAEALNTAAYATRRQSAAAVANLAQIVDLDVRLAATEVERARQQIAASQATRRFQEQVVEAEQERFGVGTSTALLVAQAQRDLLESQITETDAVIVYRLALIDLYLAEGTLLERRGIRIDERLAASR